MFKNKNINDIIFLVFKARIDKILREYNCYIVNKGYRVIK